MISVKEAYEKVKEKSMGFDLLETLETEDKWIFVFGKKCSDGKLYPGTPNITVEKDGGKVDFITIPPVQNLSLLQNAKRVEFEI